MAEDEIQERSFLAALSSAQEDIATLSDDCFSRDQVPGIPASLGQVCRVCGCSDYDACWDVVIEEPCGWVEEDLCSRCAGRRAGCGPGKEAAA